MLEKEKFDEKGLLIRVAEGDETAFRQLFDQYRPRIYSFAYSLTHNDLLALEITQDVFIRVWEKRSQLAQMDYFGPWIRTIARNTAYSFFRRHALEKKALSYLAQTAETTTDASGSRLEERELERRLRSVLDELTPQQKTILRMSQEESKTYAEIAEALQISNHTVKYHVTSIFRRLRLKLGLH